jgi:hypothetical protein
MNRKWSIVGHETGFTKRRLHGRLGFLSVLGLVSVALAADSAEPTWPADLNPVKFRQKPTNAPVALVEGGKTAASIAAMGNAAGTPALELQKYILAATGVKLPITNKITPPAIVLGDCPEAAAQALVGKEMPPEGFAIKTADNLVVHRRQPDRARCQVGRLRVSRTVCRDALVFPATPA